MTCKLCEKNEAVGHLCPGCTKLTNRRLADMAGLYEALAAFLHPGGRRPEMGRARPSEAPLGLYEPAFNLRGPGGMVGILEDWRSAMQADRGWGEPAVQGPTAHRVTAAARGLQLNLEWMAASWYAVGDMAADIRDLERSVMLIIDPPDPAKRGRHIGQCIAIDVRGTVCGADLRHYPGETSMRCAWCLCSYPPSMWLALQHFQPRPEGQAAPAA